MSYTKTHSPVKGTPWTPSRLFWLALACLPKIGSQTIHKLRQAADDDGELAADFDYDDLRQAGLTDELANRIIIGRHKVPTDEIVTLLEKQQIHFILFSDPEYPALLKEIADPPAMLFVRGDLARLPQPCVAMVGTRACTPYGKAVATDLAQKVARAGITIVSGLALGIDGIAHAAALEEHGHCLAVLGGGCDDETVYPREHANLAKQILDTGGVILTESPPGLHAMPYHFPMRNRIIGGLSKTVVVIEAAEGSGSLITAHLALDQNRDVLAVPGPINSKQSFGTNRLLRLGAIPCTKVDDIFESLGLPTGNQTQLALATGLTKAEDALLRLLDGPTRPDVLARLTQQPITAISVLLTALELRGLIIPSAPGQYIRHCRLPAQAGQIA